MTIMRSYLDIVSRPLKEGVVIHDAEHMMAFTIAVAEAYDAAPRFDEALRKSWDALNAHNNDILFKQIEGSGVKVIFTPDDPYDDGTNSVGLSVRRMLWDMVVNNRLYIYSGHSDDHPVFSAKDNVVFRSVHDFYTHGRLRMVLRKQAALLGMTKGKTPSDKVLQEILPNINLAKHGNVGHAFTARGEMNAYSTHCKLAPDAAAPALFTEIVGQLCYNACCGDFPAQKATILGDFDFKRVGLAKPGSRAERRMEEILAQLEHGAESIETTIKAKHVISVPELRAMVARTGNSF